MLRLHTLITKNSKPLGCERYVYSAQSIFDAVMDRSWFDDPVVEQMVLDIDRTEHIKGSVFDSPWLGPISPRELSGGVKGLILVYKCFDIPRIFNSGIWGDNCCGWLRKLSFMVDYGIYFVNSLNWEQNMEIMAQKWDAPDWNRRDFTNTDEVWDYYAETRDRVDPEYYPGIPVGDPNKLF